MTTLAVNTQISHSRRLDVQTHLCSSCYRYLNQLQALWPPACSFLPTGEVLLATKPSSLVILWCGAVLTLPSRHCSLTHAEPPRPNSPFLSCVLASPCCPSAPNFHPAAAAAAAVAAAAAAGLQRGGQENATTSPAVRSADYFRSYITSGAALRSSKKVFLFPVES